MEKGIRILQKANLTPKHKAEQAPYEYVKYPVTNDPSHDPCCVMIYEIPPLKANYPYHYHTCNTEVFYIISGEGILESPEGERVIKPGDVIYCPPTAEAAHLLRNTSTSEKLCYIEFDTNQMPDLVHYPRTHKVGMMLAEEDNLFFKEADRVAYYEGEEGKS